MFGYIRGLVKKYDRIVYIRFRNGKITFYHYPLGLRYQDEPILAVKRKGNAFVVSAVGKKVYELKEEDSSVVYEPFNPFMLEPENFALAEKVVRALMQHELSFMYRLFLPKVIIHPDKSYVSEMEAQAYKELALSAGAREAVVYVGDELSVDEIEDVMKKK
ncbi:MAG: hypothetical protein PF439_03100 [Helicobacteraceae bacterium]|jgi:rod shape-determining protein MreB|nr:hypothetical protein [Helicobacteraceae bacterium]